jgi:hypothetical protein
MNFNRILPIIFSSIAVSGAFCPTTTYGPKTTSQLLSSLLLEKNKNDSAHCSSVGFRHKRQNSFLLQSTQTSSDSNKITTNSNEATNAVMTVPLTFDAMIKQVSQAITDAKSQGTNRQIIRVLLPRDPNSGNLGQYFEDAVEVEGGTRSTQNLLLAPPDESWQGGDHAVVSSCPADLQGDTEKGEWRCGRCAAKARRRSFCG